MDYLKAYKGSKNFDYDIDERIIYLLDEIDDKYNNWIIQFNKEYL